MVNTPTVQRGPLVFSTSHVIPHDRAMVLILGVIYLHAQKKVISVGHIRFWHLDKLCSLYLVTLSLLIKRNLQIFEIVMPEVGIETQDRLFTRQML